MTEALDWLGARARWVLAVGVLIAMLLPALSSLLRPLLPAFVVLIFALAVTRLDLSGLVARRDLGGRLLRLGAWTAGLLVAAPLVGWSLGRAAGLDAESLASVVYTGAAPPITSAAGLCLLLGLDAVFALELTVVASLAAPFVGPLVIGLLLGEAVPVDPLALTLRTAAMIGTGTVIGLMLRRRLGPNWIAARARAFDGVQALAMLVFVIPLFDGVWALIAARPGFALGTLALAFLVNFGTQAAVAALARGQIGSDRAGAAGVVFGNRTVALYLAAMPPDPAFALYVAFFQLPMLFTPLVMGGLLRGRPGKPM